MKKYIGFKLVEAEPKKRRDHSYPSALGDGTPLDVVLEDGYKVTYSDGYESWSPKDVFESAYMQVGDNNTITQELVDSMIKDVHVQTMLGKTTVVVVELVTGFTITESSSCVDPANYDEKYGAEICMEKIKDKIWYGLGFMLQAAKFGIKGGE